MEKTINELLETIKESGIELEDIDKKLFDYTTNDFLYA